MSKTSTLRIATGCPFDRRPSPPRAIPLHVLSTRNSYSRPPHCVGLRESRSWAASARISAINQVPTICSGAVHCGARPIALIRASAPSQTMSPSAKSTRTVQPRVRIARQDEHAKRARRQHPRGKERPEPTRVPTPPRQAPRLAVRRLRIDPLPAAPELPPVGVHPTVEQAVCQENARLATTGIDATRQRDILEQRILDGFDVRRSLRRHRVGTA